MSVKEIKETLHREIDASDDEWTLQEVYELLQHRRRLQEEEKSSAVYKLSDAQRAAIKEGREQIARGECYTQEEVDRELDEWFEEEEKRWAEK